MVHRSEGRVRRTARRRGLASGALLAVAGLLAACGGSGSSGRIETAAQSSQRVSNAPIAQITWATANAGRSLNHYTSNEPGTIIALSNVLGGMLQFDRDGKLQPALADSWRKVDPVTYEYDLRPGVRFSDGTPLTATDVVYSLGRNVDPKGGSILNSFYGSVKSITADGPMRVIVKLKHPDNFWHYIPAHTAGWIVEKRAAERAGKRLGTPSAPPIGTGPYKIAEFVPDDHITLVVNPYYWGPKPRVQRITIKTIADDANRLVAVRTGDVQGTFDVPLASSQQWEGLGNVNLTTTPSVFYINMVYNTRVKPFGDVHVRRALSYAIDAKGIVDSLFHGNARVATAFPSPELWVGNGLTAAQAAARQAALPQYQFDIARAKQELAKSSVPHGFTVTTPVPPAPGYLSQIIQVIQADWAKLGVKLTIKQEPETKWLTDTEQRNFQVLLTEGYADFPDAMENPYYNYDGKFANPLGFNLANYENPALDKLLDRQLVEQDQAKRLQISFQALQIAQDQVANQQILWEQQVMALDKQYTLADYGPWTFFTPWAARLGKVG